MNVEKNHDQSKETKKESPSISIPQISAPKGGGAIRGIGEKFAANPVTGTGSLTIPIFTSPGRSGFGPQLSLSYDSGSGNGPFGLGWNLSLPSITRKTDKGLPQYFADSKSEDVFILSGAEDLVPALVKIEKDGDIRWEEPDLPPRTINGIEYKIKRYRPRIEGLFARIEKWTSNGGDVHWRSISKDNVLTVYGKDEKSRIYDPDNKHRIFSWLVCESYDDKGNAIVYEYAPETETGVDLSQTNERNRIRTANRYPKRILYGNRQPLLLDTSKSSFRKQHLEQLDFSSAGWMFEVVFDYGEDHYKVLDSTESKQHVLVQAAASPNGAWQIRPDPFSTYRAGFEVRTYRRCQRILMFHNFSELGSEPYLVRSTDFDYSDLDYSTPVDVKDECKHKGSTRFSSFICAVHQSGYVRDDSKAVVVTNNIKYYTYLKKSLPPLEFEYSKATIQENEINEIDSASLENIPHGLDGSSYQWVDLEGEGLSGILTEQANAWFYKPNLGGGKFGPLETVSAKPSLANLSGGRQQLLDLEGNGKLDLVELDSQVPGFYERTQDKNWENFTPFASLPNISWKDPNLKFIDLTGDGHADVLITEDEVFTWYQSLAEKGFGMAAKTHQILDEEKGPRLIFGDGTQSVYLADMSGDGLADLVRIRNGEICYWPNLGYGRFGAKVTMDNSPLFDAYDQFDQKRIRLADIDGSGVVDIVYLKHDGVRIFFNQSGNRWSDAYTIANFPNIDNLSSVQVADLLGNGTACLVWSSPLPNDTQRSMRYMDMMGGQKPHLMIISKNNLGAETRITYCASTKFYLADKAKGKPWITRLPFPVHVVERVETYDRISRNRFVTRYTYHHGYFDGVEREFRGFGMVEQWDTEEFAALSSSDSFPTGDNILESSHVPPMHTKTWFHTGAYFEGGLISKQFAEEYYHEGDPSLVEGDLDPDELQTILLPDTVLTDDLTAEEAPEAYRSLKGSILHQEIYALDHNADRTPTEESDRPYTVSERNYTIKCLQPRGDNKHAVFFVHPRETLDFHYERKLYDVTIAGQTKKNRADPRISHAMTLEVDDFGNVIKSAAIGYGRRMDSPDQLLLPEDREKQRLIHITCTENKFTSPVVEVDANRNPMPSETCAYELRKPQQEKSKNGLTSLYQFDALLRYVNQAGDGNHDIDYEDIDFIKAQNAVTTEPEEANRYFRRPIECVRTLYRSDKLDKLLPPEIVGVLALPGETYKLAFTSRLIANVYQRKRGMTPAEPLHPDFAAILKGKGSDRGGYVDDADGNWWIPSGRIFYSKVPETPNQELTFAERHFFLPHRFEDPFDKNVIVTYDGDETNPQKNNNLFLIETLDPVGNKMSAENEYRVLQPILVTDPNGSVSEVRFDALGLVVATAIYKGSEGGSLLGIETDITQKDTDDFFSDPQGKCAGLIKKATTRIVYDMNRYYLTKDPDKPPYASVMACETYASEHVPKDGLKVQINFSYSDGFGREIQKKIQAESGDVDGVHVEQRWVGNGWTIFNNKGKPVRKYEPFFSKTHHFEFAKKVGVSSILFYDPAGRVIATLYPNYTYEKVLFDPWRQVTWDVNDNILVADPKNDPDIGSFFNRLPDTDYLPTWYKRRDGGVLGPEEQNAASKAAVHAGTPTIIHFDSLGRTFLTIAHNKFKRSNTLPADPPEEEFYRTHVLLDIEGNQREVRDAMVQNGDKMGRIVMKYDYDVLGTKICQQSMEAGEEWMLNDVTGKPVYMWKSPSGQEADPVQTFQTKYDALRRPIQSFVKGFDRTDFSKKILFERTIYGEQHPEAEKHNLRGKAYLQCDSAGVITSEFDFKGNLKFSTRQLVSEYKKSVDWSSVDATIQDPINLGTINTAILTMVENEIFSSSTIYDALNRPVQIIAPHSATTKINVIQHVYNEANLLEKVHVWLDNPTEPTELLDANTATPLIGVDDIDYDPKGQRALIKYKNGVTTRYTYDPKTFRLVRLYTRRGETFTEDCSGHTPGSLVAAPDVPPDEPCGLQNLQYTYDPVGNITHIRDNAQQTIFFKQLVEPSNDYTYDAIYRLIEAKGREHLGQVPCAPQPYSDTYYSPIANKWSANNGEQMGTYIEEYFYDGVGNFSSIKHYRSDPSNPKWTRSYSYGEKSLLESTKQSNRLSGTSDKCDVTDSVTYHHDEHGNMISMHHLTLLEWNYRDQLKATSTQKVITGTPETTYYVYDSSGQRVRKVTEFAADVDQIPKRKDERIYLGGFELYRKYCGDGSTKKLERESLHIMDDKSRIALIETKTIDDSTELDKPEILIRYQLGNHLGSAILELDDKAEIISYEEYYPYGSTSYQAARSQTETPKRYRYTGKERDEETGFSYHGARYYAPWLGRWVSTDPSGIDDGLNVFKYVHANPVRLTDQTGLAGNENDWSDVDKIRRELDKQGTNLKLEDKRTHAKPLKTPMTKEEARQYANKQAARERRASGMTDPDVQAGHTAAARDSPRSGIKPQDWDKQTFQQLSSKRGKGLDVEVTHQSGKTTTTTRHRAQEKLIDQETARVVETSGTLTPQGQLDAAEQLTRATENVPLDQRNVDLVRNGGYAKPEPGPKVNPETGVVEGSAVVSGSKLGGALKGGTKAVAPMVLSFLWDKVREKNAEEVREILSKTNPTQEELELAKGEGFNLEVNPDTGKTEWFWAPSWDRRLVEIFHFMLTFEDPWDRFRSSPSNTSPVYGRDYL